MPGVDLLRARYVTHRYARHAHETYTIALIETGVEEFSYRGGLLRAGPGTIVLQDPETVHTGHAGVPEGWSYRGLYPLPSLVREVAAEAGLHGTPHFPAALVSDSHSAALLRAAHRAAEHGDRLASSSLLHAALTAVLGAHARPAATGPQRVPAGTQRAVRTARDLLHERVTSPPSLAELAELTGLGPGTLLRAFRAQTGLPPHAYLTQLRVRLARGLLDQEVAPAEAAARTGFADQAI